MNSIELTETMFRVLRDFIYKISGIFFADEDRLVLESRLQQELRKKEISNFADYYYLLKYDPQRDNEIATLLDLVTIHETYFFRENKQLDTFMNEVVPELAEREKGSKRLRIWSAGCATGEEAYTLSMLFLENHHFRNLNIEIYATDISRTALAVARRGIYRESAFRATDPYFQKTYFSKEESGFRIADTVKQKVVFLHLNFFEQERWGLLPVMDAIFCRNVIIYFGQDAKKRVLASFYQKLKEGGFFLMGYSESLINMSTDFIMRHFKNDLLYQRVTPTTIFEYKNEKTNSYCRY